MPAEGRYLKVSDLLKWDAHRRVHDLVELADGLNVALPGSFLFHLVADSASLFTLFGSGVTVGAEVGLLSAFHSESGSVSLG